MAGSRSLPAFDLGLTRQREADAPSALDHVGITPVGGWTRRSECTPEVFYDVLAAEGEGMCVLR